MGREEKWVNVAKVMAILAVLTDHTYMVLYDNDLILLGSFFFSFSFYASKRLYICDRSGEKEKLYIVAAY